MQALWRWYLPARWLIGRLDWLQAESLCWPPSTWGVFVTESSHKTGRNATRAWSRRLAKFSQRQRRMFRMVSRRYHAADQWKISCNLQLVGANYTSRGEFSSKPKARFAPTLHFVVVFTHKLKILLVSEIFNSRICFSRCSISGLFTYQVDHWDNDTNQHL